MQFQAANLREFMAEFQRQLCGHHAVFDYPTRWIAGPVRVVSAAASSRDSARTGEKPGSLGNVVTPSGLETPASHLEETQARRGLALVF
jgi:hypothetical protein